MLDQTKLVVKVKVTKKKTINKMVDIIKKYKDLKYIIEQSR